MPIYGRTLREAVGEFVHHLNSLLSRTLTHTPLQSFVSERIENGTRREIAVVTFPRQSDGTATIELATRYGPMDFYIAQTLDGVEDPDRKQLRLRTVSYVYALQPHSWDDRIVRWEYVKFPAQESFWCRHHLQGPLEFAIRDSRGATHTSTLNEWHLPTGWVTIEEVIRFCLHDLEASALTDRQEWHAALNDSIEIFRTRFSAFGEM